MANERRYFRVDLLLELASFEASGGHRSLVIFTFTSTLLTLAVCRWSDLLKKVSGFLYFIFKDQKVIIDIASFPCFIRNVGETFIKHVTLP